MATLQVVSGIVQPFGGGPAVFSAGAPIVSQNLASGVASAACPSSVNAVRLKAIGGAMWVAYGVTPDASVAAARFHLSDGETLDMIGVAGLKFVGLDV